MLAIYKDLVRKGLKAVEEVPLKFRGEFRELTLEEEREVKKEELKSIRDSREVEIIAYGDKTFDYDDKARERMQGSHPRTLPHMHWCMRGRVL